MNEKEDEILISHVVPELNEEAVHLWSAGFGDDEDYIRFFFHHHKNRLNGYVARLYGEIVSAIYILPCRIWHTEDTFSNVNFLYAASTRKDLRGQGICANMFNTMRQEKINDTNIFLLRPASEKLEAYYKRGGMKSLFYLKKVSFFQTEYTSVLDVKLCDCTVKQYEKLRNAYFEKHDYIQWDREALAYAIEENAYCGGFCRIADCDCGQYLLLGRKEKDGTLFIQETTIPDEKLSQISTFLMQKYQCRQVTYLLPVFTAFEGESYLAGMGDNLQIDPNNHYFNLTID